MKSKILSINFKDELTETNYQGTLTLMALNEFLRAKIRAKKSFLNDGLPFTTKEDELRTETLATILIVYSNPTNGAENWFTLENLDSAGLIAYLYNQHQEYEVSLWGSVKRNEFYKAIGKPQEKLNKQGENKPTNKVNGVVRKDVPHSENEFVTEDVVVGGAV